MAESLIADALQSLRVPLASLNVDSANARVHDVRNIDAIKSSFARFGQRLPVVVQKRGMIVRAGNGRVMAARALGWDEIAAVVVDESNVDAAAFAIADNRTAELAAWDDDMLGAILNGLREDGFDIGQVGFTDAELSSLLATPAADTPPDDFAEVDENIETHSECPKCGYRWSGGKRGAPPAAETLGDEDDALLFQ
jgi:ParB-like chromosome segregation protein Spo0J